MLEQTAGLAPVQIEQRQEDRYIVEAQALARRHGEESGRHQDATLKIAQGWLSLRERVAAEMFGPKPLDPAMYEVWLRVDSGSRARAKQPHSPDARFFSRWLAIVDASRPESYQEATWRQEVARYCNWGRNPAALTEHRERDAARKRGVQNRATRAETLERGWEAIIRACKAPSATECQRIVQEFVHEYA